MIVAPEAIERMHANFDAMRETLVAADVNAFFYVGRWFSGAKLSSRSTSS